MLAVIIIIKGSLTHYWNYFIYDNYVFFVVNVDANEEYVEKLTATAIN